MSIFNQKDRVDDSHYDDDYVPSQYHPQYTITEASLIRIADALEKIATNLQFLPTQTTEILETFEKIESNIRSFSDDGK